MRSVLVSTVTSRSRRVALPHTVAAGGGGKHLYYRWSPSVQSSQDSILKGLLDARGNGGERDGYVLGAGDIP